MVAKRKVSVPKHVKTEERFHRAITEILPEGFELFDLAYRARSCGPDSPPPGWSIVVRFKQRGKWVARGFSWPGLADPSYKDIQTAASKFLEKLEKVADRSLVEVSKAEIAAVNRGKIIKPGEVRK